MIYDVAIIGAGIIGASIARELSRYKLKTCMLEKEDDVCCGTSKANSGIIHGGYDPKPDTLMAKLNAQGTTMFPTLAEQLHFDFKQTGSLVIAFAQDELAHLQDLLERGKQNGVPNLSIVDQQTLRTMEPNINPEALAALYSPTAGIISPYQATWSIAENAVDNGVKLFCNAEVHAIKRENSDKNNAKGGKKALFTLNTGIGTIQAHFVVNAAGLFADKINEMAGARPFAIVPRRGEYSLLDNNCKDLARHVLFQTPNAMGKGVLITPTVDDNILIGPSADDYMDKTYTATTRTGQDFIMEKGEKTIPDIPRRNIINSFAGVRAIGYYKNEDGSLGKPINDFLIEEDAAVKGFITVGGITSPGLTAAPAIGTYVVDLLEKAGLHTTPNKDFIHIHKGIENFKSASFERKSQMIEENPLHGRIICRCEMITEGEIVQAIHSSVGAVDLDGVKRRTRAGMGRCQGGFCSPRVTEIISRELKTPMISISKNGGCSYILHSSTREVKR